MLERTLSALVTERPFARRFATVALTLTALAGGLLGEPDLARACTYLPVNFELPSDRVPVNGPIVVDVGCQETDFCKVGAPPLLRVFDGVQVVEGALEMVRGDLAAFLVWRPTMPLQQGREYRIEVPEVAGSGGSRELNVRADAGFSWAAASEPSWTLSNVVEDTGERFCCFAGQACFDHCFTEQRIVKAVLTPELTASPERASIVYALRWSEADGTKRELGYRRPSRFQEPSQWDVLASFDQPAGEYCATLEVRNLVDGRSQEFSRCFAPDPAVSYGASVSFTPDSNTLRDCQVPPGVEFECEGAQCAAPSAKYLRAWCDANRMLCAAPAQRSYCDRYASFCDGLSPDSASSPDGSVADAGVLLEGTGATRDENAGAGGRDTQGCTAAPGSAPSWSWLLWLLPLLRREGRRRC